ncbi:unnamed protein product [Symbiodinium pilosum]|uniref:Uncharacterized protein n=1 Tax=Symbiodinium pilosum TaxID=2952 RepID=A0A812XQ87_SYMPI|nr:unnamed protein product [Symbiodinium pilosum]
MAAASRAGHNFPRSAAAVFGMRRDNAFPKLAVLKIYLGEDYRSSNFRLYCTLSVAGHALDSARYASLKPIASVAEVGLEVGAKIEASILAKGKALRPHV